jgi:hypothetical protein
MPDSRTSPVTISVGGIIFKVGDETTRPADATAYAAGDAVAAAVTDTATTPLRSLAVARFVGGSGYLTKFRLLTDQVGCVAQMRVHFYTLAVPTGAVVGDNVQMTLLYLNKACRIGHLDFPALATSTIPTSSTAAAAQNYVDRIPFQCEAADLNIYYRLETLSIFTPANSQKFYLEVLSDEN